MPAPMHPKIYHIVHVDRLPAILEEGALLCDATMIARPGAGTTIGMGSIKTRRLTLPVTCHPGLNVGDCVPFYFCSRSVMLYLLRMGNHAELTYRGGQGPIVHLEADLREVVEWANAGGRRWAFSLSNAGAYYTQFRSDLAQLNEINWVAVAATDFRPSDIKEGKQAEFLVHERFPWGLVRRIGVQTPAMAQRVSDAIRGAAHRPPVEILPAWYY